MRICTSVASAMEYLHGLDPPIIHRSHILCYYYTVLHYTTLYYTTLRYTTLHYTTLHYTTLHSTPLHSTPLHYTTLHYTTLHSTPLHYTTLHYTTLHYTTNTIIYWSADEEQRGRRNRGTLSGASVPEESGRLQLKTVANNAPSPRVPPIATLRIPNSPEASTTGDAELFLWHDARRRLCCEDHGTLVTQYSFTSRVGPYFLGVCWGP